MLFRSFPISLLTLVLTLVMLSLPFEVAANKKTILKRVKIAGGNGQIVEPFYAIIQGNLKILDIYNGAIDNHQGTSTTSAIKKFQRINGLPVTGSINAATAQTAKAKVSAYYRSKLGFDFNGDWAPVGKCNSSKRFRIQQSVWFTPTKRLNSVIAVDFVRASSGAVSPRFTKRWPKLRVSNGRLYTMQRGPVVPSKKPSDLQRLSLVEERPEPAPAELENWDPVADAVPLHQRTLVEKPAITVKTPKRTRLLIRLYYQRCI